MKKIFALLTINSILLFSCSNPQSTNEEAGATDSISTVIPAADAQPSVVADSAMGTAIATPEVQSQAPAGATAAGMNPAHGQPGHRCDIAVGAPLNSPPGAQPAPTSQPAVTTQPSTTIQPSPSFNTSPSITTAPQTVPAIQPATAMPAGTKVNTPPGMNPPHGEPGHDCAVKVGEPLKKN